jgi:signal transduction histidine kinase
VARVVVTAAPDPALASAGRNFLRLTVEDDGPGLPPEKRSEALKRGRRLDESKPGSGLGLSIVAETAAMYQGSITLGEARPGGLSAELVLPASS